MGYTNSYTKERKSNQKICLAQQDPQLPPKGAIIRFLNFENLKEDIVR